MEPKLFSELVNKHFGFLRTEYGYSVTEKFSVTEPNRGGSIEFRSEVIVLSVTFDHTDLSVTIRPIAEPEIARLQLEAIVQFLTHGKVKKIVKQKWYILSFSKMIDQGLEMYTSALRQYCEPLLREEVSWWLDACKYTRKQFEELYRSKTGLELGETQFSMYIKAKEKDNDLN